MIDKITLSGILETIPYFNRVTLSSLINKSGDSLNYWIKSLIKTGEIVPLKNGLFVGRPFLLKIKGQIQLWDNYREYLASVLRTPSYISLEYALATYGVLTETPFAITSITSKSSRTFSNDFGSFIYRNIKRPLFDGYKEKYFQDKRYYIATPVKALFDYIYLKTFSRKTFGDDIEYGLRINWDFFKKENIKELGMYVEKSQKKKMKMLMDIIIKRKLI